MYVLGLDAQGKYLSHAPVQAQFLNESKSNACFMLLSLKMQSKKLPVRGQLLTE